MVQVLASVVVAEFALLEVQVERAGVHAAEPGHAGLGVAPEALDAVNVVAADGPAAELVRRMIDPQVLLVSHVHQAVVALEPIGVDDRTKVHFPQDRGQNRVFFTTLDHLRVDLPVPLADAEHDRLLAGPSAGLALDAAWAEVALVNLDVPAEGPLELARPGHALAQAGEESVHGVAVEPGELRDLNRRQVRGHVPQEPAENSLTNS